MSSRLELGSDGWPILLSDGPTSEDPEVARRSLDEEMAQRAVARRWARNPAWQPSGDEDLDRMVLSERMELVADLIVQSESVGPRGCVKLKAPRGFVRDRVSALDDSGRDDLMALLRCRGLSAEDAAIAANV
jgi:hypothetical protein